MSRRGDCWHDAFAESSFSTFKTESGIDELIPNTCREAEPDLLGPPLPSLRVPGGARG